GLLMIERGAFAGASNAPQEPHSKPGNPDSAMVGISGYMLERCFELTPSARNLPSFTSVTELAIGAMANCTLPATASVSDSGMPLYGTWTTSMLALCFNISPAKCVPLPVPADEKLSCPGLALASAMNSCTVLMPSAGGPTNRSVAV